MASQAHRPLWCFLSTASLALACVGTPSRTIDPSDTRPPPELRDNEGPPTPFIPAVGVQSQLLLSWQIRNTVADVLGEAAAAKLSLPADGVLHGFGSISASQLSVSPLAVSRYDESARAAAAAALATDAARKALYGCAPTSSADARCFATLLSKVGRRLFRRTLDAEELARWVKLATDAAATFGSFDKGAEFALAAQLQAPSFLYLTAIGEPDPSNPARRRLTGVELATRISAFLLGTLPDEALLNAAEQGSFDTADGVRSQVQALLKSPRARGALTRFLDDAYLLGGVPRLTKSAAFPAFTASVANAMREESQTFLQSLFFDGTDFRGALSADYSYVNDVLARFYGMPGGGSTFIKTPLPASSGRAGILGQGAFLVLNAHTETTSPTRRGKFVRENILCESIPSPPPNVDLTATSKPSATPMTMRERLAEHQQNPSCATCHKSMDNIGLVFEHFDSSGAFRDKDQGLNIDTQTTTEDLGALSGPLDLATRLHDDPRVVRCMTLRLFRAAAGRVETEGEATPLREARQRFVNAGHDARELLVELLSSPAFRYLSETP